MPHLHHTLDIKWGHPHPIQLHPDVHLVLSIQIPSKGIITIHYTNSKGITTIHYTNLSNVKLNEASYVTINFKWEKL